MSEVILPFYRSHDDLLLTVSTAKMANIILFHIKYSSEYIVYLKRVNSNEPIWRRHDTGSKRYHRVITVDEKLSFTATTTAYDCW